MLNARLKKLRATGARNPARRLRHPRPPSGGVLAGHSLAPLRQLPVDGVKLDRTLIAEIDGPDGVDALAAVRTLCELGAALDLGVVAEGVERTEQAVLLTEAGCSSPRASCWAPRSVVELGSELTADELGPVEPAAAVPALADLVDFTDEAGEDPTRAWEEGPLDAAALFAREFGPAPVPPRRRAGDPARPLAPGGPGTGARARPHQRRAATDVRRLLDQSR